MAIGFGAEEEAWAYRTGRAAPAPASVANDMRAFVNQRKQEQYKQQTGRAPQQWTQPARKPFQPAPPPPPPKPVQLYGQDPRRAPNKFLDSWFGFEASKQPEGILGGDAPAGANIDPKTGLPIVAAPPPPQGMGARDKRVLSEEHQESLKNWAENQVFGEKRTRYNSDDTKAGSGEVKIKAENLSINGMLDDLKDDPAPDPEQRRIATALADRFRSDLHSRKWTFDEVKYNPLLVEINNTTVWSRYRKQVADWNEKKSKLGAETVDNGDGTFSNVVSGSFSTALGTSSLSPYVVARDENGMMNVLTVDKWVRGKLTDMKNDENYAANAITALASVTAYGNDAAANSAAGARVVTDAEGNPVRAFVSNEDFTALKNFATLASTFQHSGDNVAIDDVLEELTKQSQEIYHDPEWEPPSSGGGGGGGYGGGGYGYGGGGYGGGGGASGAVRFTDSEMLKAQVDAIARTRMGRSLTPEESQEFINFYHGLEQTMTAAYYAGQSNTQLDPEGQAVGWIESRFAQEKGAQQYGQLAAAFMKMVGSGGFAGAMSFGSN